MTIVVSALTVVVILLTILVLGHDGADTSNAAALLPDPERRVPHASERVVEATGDGSVHDISGTTPRGSSLVVGLAQRDERTLLAFLTSGCATCKGFWDAFRRDQPLPRSVDRLVIVTRSNDEESPAALMNLAPERHKVVMSSQAWDDYGIPVSPYFVLVDGPTNQIEGEGAASTWAQVGSLLGRAEADSEAANERRIDAELEAAGIGADDPSLYPHDLPEVTES